VGNLPQALRLAARDSTTVIALDETSRQQAGSLGIDCYSAGNFLLLSEAELRQFADTFSQQWYLVNGIDFSEIDGNSQGELFHTEVSYKGFFELERLMILVQEIDKQQKPERWIVATDRNPQLSALIGAIATPRTMVHVLRPSISQWLKRYANFHELKLWLRRQGLDYYIRTLSFKLMFWQRKPKAPVSQMEDKGSILYVIEIPTASAMETLIPVIHRTPAAESMVIAGDPRCQAALSKHGIASLPFEAQSLGIKEPALPGGLKRTLRDNWKALSAHQIEASQMVFRGVDLWPMMQDNLRNLYLRRIPMALRHYHLATQVLTRYQVRAVVVATDNHYFGQIITRAARQLGRYSLTIQHGMVNHPQGYLPVRATQLAVMGEAVKEWLIQYGARPEQIVVTGQPRFDKLLDPPETPRAQLFEQLDLDLDCLTLLMAPEPQLGIWMRDLLFEALEKLVDLQAIVRVHPNDNPLDYEIGLNLHPGLSSRVRINRQHDVSSVLHACDGVVLGRSTIGLEALLVGKIFLAVHPGDNTGWIIPPYLQEYLAEAPYLRIQNADDLLRAWNLVRSNTVDMEDLRLKIIHRYATVMEGGSASCVLTAIEDGIRKQ
jgi:hypothetical protein